MKSSTTLIGVYAAIVFLGGIFGYIQAASLPSLIGGTTSALLLSGSAWLMIKNHKLGYGLSLFLICLLTLFFSYRFALTQKFMPSGIMIAVSVIVGLILLTQNPYRLNKFKIEK